MVRGVLPFPPGSCLRVYRVEASAFPTLADVQSIVLTCALSRILLVNSCITTSPYELLYQYDSGGLEPAKSTVLMTRLTHQ